MQNRACGRCTACCKTHAVREIGKPADTWCVHCVRGKRCGIYVSRPTGCREFTCQWLLGLFRTSERPDKSGFVTDVVQYSFGGMEVPVALLWECEQGALSRSSARRAQQLLAGLRYSVLLIPIGCAPKLYLREEYMSGGRMFCLEDGRSVSVLSLSSLIAM